MGVCLRKINYGESPTSFNPSMIRTENSTKTTTYFDSVLDNNCDIIGLIVQYLDGKSTLHMKKSKIFEFFILSCVTLGLPALCTPALPRVCVFALI